MNGNSAKLLVDRNFLADHGGGEHLPHGLVGIDLAGVLRHLHGDIAGEGAARQDHRIAPYVGGAFLGVFGGVVGKAGAVSMLSGLMPPVPAGLALKAVTTSL